jgi:hypothetical protein
MEFHKFKELTYFSVHKGHIRTYQLLGLYPAQTTKLFILLIWESGCSVKEKSWRLLILQTGNTERCQGHGNAMLLSCIRKPLWR